MAPFDSLVIGLTMDRLPLYMRIDRRIDAMIEVGWLDEIARLLEEGADPASPSFAAIGYRELSAHLSGEMPLSEAITTARRASRRLVRQQYAWFPLDDSRIHWLEADEGAITAANALIQSWLEGKSEG